MGWDSPRIESRDPNRYVEVEQTRGVIYIEVYAEHVEGGSVILEMSYAQARNFRDQINVALYVAGEN